MSAANAESTHSEPLLTVSRAMLAGDSHVVDGEQLASALMFDCVKAGVSDIHIVPRKDDTLLRVRIDGALLDGLTLDHEGGLRLMRHMQAMANMSVTNVFLPEVARREVEFEGRSLDLRITVVPTLRGEAMTIRLLDPNRMALSIDQLGLARLDRASIGDWLKSVLGMVLVAGPTGCGKTTTAYALLQKLHAAKKGIVTVEDPVEFPVDGITQIQLDRKRGLGFAEGVRATLRMDSDVIMVGEIRDRESAGAAIDAALSGHIVVSTLHARDAVSAISCLKNWDASKHEIASSVRVVVGQRLVRKLCSACRRIEKPTEDQQAWLKSLELPVPHETWQAGGCRQCFQTGYSGQTGVFEVWKLLESDYERILQGLDEHRMREHLAKRDHRNMLTDGIAMVAAGVTTLSELQNLGGLIAPLPSTSSAAKIENDLKSGCSDS